MDLPRRIVEEASTQAEAARRARWSRSRAALIYDYTDPAADVVRVRVIHLQRDDDDTVRLHFEDDENEPPTEPPPHEWTRHTVRGAQDAIAVEANRQRLANASRGVRDAFCILGLGRARPSTWKTDEGKADGFEIKFANNGTEPNAIKDVKNTLWELFDVYVGMVF